MWKTSQLAKSPVSASPESSRSILAICAPQLDKHAELLARQQSVFGPGLVLVGDIEGVESLSSFYIEGTIEGNVNLPGTHVTVGRSGKVSAGIVARTILVNGAVTGNVTASERLEVRAGASLTGDAIAPRVTIEDGALVRGSVLITKDAEELAAVIQMAPAAKSRKNADARQDSQIPMMVPALRSA